MSAAVAHRKVFVACKRRGRLKRERRSCAWYMRRGPSRACAQMCK
eukprot:CAMPEP_0195081224 /NCGR_PEP_ID=MMETSP0448-20130528/22740_1 /TAXON_ID=66468 /ORGANISM="Heterocapsa triquestra, Strain CCMP 448" /LENGTH=44 /DNA_ID= /DNA_START= /DNA_END= /DNA_ORIENTATION=